MAAHEKPSVAETASGSLLVSVMMPGQALLRPDAYPATEMKTIRCLLPVVCLAAFAPALHAQGFFVVTKSQFFLQTAASGSVADPNGAFVLSATAPTTANLVLPGGSTIPLILRGGDGESAYQLERRFATKASMDAAFPNGTYRLMTGSQAISLPLISDNYPSGTPRVTSVTNGTWNANGLLVVDPSQPVTLNFSTFSNYGTALVSHMNFYVWGLSDNVERGYEVISQPGFGQGMNVQSMPFTSYTIPAGTFTSGRAYQAELDWDNFVSGDIMTVPGNVTASGFTSVLTFYIAAQAPGTSTPPPVIVTQPAGQTVQLGGDASFSVGVTVGGSNQFMNMAFEWRRNGQTVPYYYNPGGKYTGSNGSTLRINNVTAADLGTYTVTLVNAGGVATSQPAMLSTGTPTAPAVTAQPASAVVNSGSTIALTVGASGNPAPNFQWYLNDAPIAGANTDTLLISSVTAAQGGNYKVVITNSAGSVTSSVANLQVTTGQVSKLPNLSVRTAMVRDQTLFVGFSTQGSKDMLVRAVGPTLGAFGLGGVMEDPRIELYNAASTKVEENNDWNPSLASVFPQCGAFPLTANSRDAALRRSVSGSHTAQIKGTGAGIVLVEVYDTGGTGKLVNVSARSLVGTGDDILIAGFVVDGTAAKTLLIRAVGPRMAELWGVSDVLPDPKLEIFTSPGGVKVAENDNWNAMLQPVARSVGAFDFSPGGRDAALVITLPPGNYTAQISGVGGTTGDAIVEVYEVP